MPSLNPYLSFRTNAREAMEFYQSVFGGDLQVLTFSMFPDMAGEGEADLVMHSQLTTSDGFVLMGSDTPASMQYVPAAGMSVSVSGAEEPPLRGYWDKLADGANVTMPLGDAPWGGLFGMLTDRFGIDWMFSIGD